MFVGLQKHMHNY